MFSKTICPLLAMLATALPSQAQEGDQKTGKSFVENFSVLDKSRWYISDGWANGDHQNCTWDGDQVKVADNILSLSYAPKQTKDRKYACGEIQTHARFGHGTYEARIKAASGSGFNTGFFTYIGPAHKQPWDEIDFEFLGKDTSQVQLNSYVNGKGGNEKLVPVPGGADAAFNDYAFVWEKGRMRYYINGKLVHTVTDPAALPAHAQKIYLSLWASDNLTEWLGEFESPAKPVTAQFTRVAFTAPGDSCQFPESVACSLK